MTENNHEKTLQEINTFFNHIYILTIERATERHAAITKELAGLNFSCFYGFDKQQLSIKELESNNIYDATKAIQNNRYNKPMKLGEIACSMGHKAIYEDIVKNNYTKALILEDDVILNTSEPFHFSTIVQQLPSDWDIVYFDYHKNETSSFIKELKKIIYHIQKSLGLLKWSHTLINNLYAKPFSKNLKISGYHDFASAYGITNAAAKKIITLQTPISYPADHVLPIAITNNMLKGYITIPKVFTQLSQFNKETIGSYVES
jgi:glycosyl transferase family 25